MGYTFRIDNYTTTLYYPRRSNWDDLRFPLAGLKIPGEATTPGTDLEDGMALFEPSTDMLVTGFAQIPHDWWEGRPMKPHLHYECMSAAAGNISLKLDIKLANPNEDFPADWTSRQVILPANESLLKHAIFPLGDLNLQGYKLSAGIKFRFWRYASSGIDPYTDTWAGVLKGLEFDLHYERDKVGSGQQWSI